MVENELSPRGNRTKEGEQDPVVGEASSLLNKITVRYTCNQ